MAAEYESQRPRYLVCSLGFGILGASFVLLALGTAVPVLGILTGDRDLLAATGGRWWTLLVSLPMSYGALVGSYLLWGRWSDLAWQRRAGLLLLMNLVDAISATLQESRVLGFDVGVDMDSYVLMLITGAFGWVELYLSASLAAEVAAQLGRPSIADAGRLSERVALIGLVVWGLFHAMRTDWGAGWPPAQPRIGSPEELLIYLGIMSARVLSGVQVATLCFLAAAHSRRTWRELESSKEQLDEWPPLG